MSNYVQMGENLSTEESLGNSNELRLGQEMSIVLCHFCGSSEIRTKELEIRSINSSTMKVTSSERVMELECFNCGWIGCQDMLLASVGSF